MELEHFVDSVKLFVINIPATIKKTSIWLLISYIIPIINVFIIWGIKQDAFSFNISILNIILVTNACFVTSLIYLINKKREFITTLNIITFAVTLVFFSFSVAQIELGINVFSLKLYKIGAFSTFGLAMLFGLISKYDEVEAHSRERATSARKTTETQVDGKPIKL